MSRNEADLVGPPYREESRGKQKDDPTNYGQKE
jgi:hypothetical protein